MGINVEKAQTTLQDGLLLIDNDGNELLYITEVDGDPTGSPAPVNTYVFRRDTQTVWYKFGSGDNDWRQQRADDFTVRTGIENTVPPKVSTIQEFINSLCAPNISQKPTYLANGEIDYVEFFSGSTQTTPNRVARVDLSYTGDDPTTEMWSIYASDGSTVDKTVTFTHSWTASNLTNTTVVTS